MEDHIFKEYDIRGIVGEEFVSDDVYKIARALGVMLSSKGVKKMSTNRDGRESSENFQNNLNQGLIDSGIDVVDCGLGSSPMHYYSMILNDSDAGVMVTASHNPKKYNGLKINLANNKPFHGNDLQELLEVVKSEKIISGKGKLTSIDVKESYIKRLLSDFEGDRSLKVVWDNGNGASGELINRLVEKLPGEHTVIYGEIDGSFPNHHPDPSVHANLKDLQDKVLEVGADIGFAFDGDGDRLGVVTNKGEIINNDLLVGIFAKEELKKESGGIVIADVKCSKVLFNKISEWGGAPIMNATGNVNIKSRIQEEDALVGGEISGHIFFNRGFYGYDDALYCAVKLLNILNASDKTSSELLSEFPKSFATDEVRFEVLEDEKFSIIDKITKEFEKKDGFFVNEMDGVRAENDNGFILIRASNTQNVLSIRCESLVSESHLEEMIDLAVQEMVKAGVNITKEDLLS
ncbi:MAG: phosphomannomutase/phosphoglucomutase [Alphaproteobacteria bacterium]|nr:phosphomannomutase/phosphoglucomutase [Alphaproteobacteria bacterium]